MRKRKVITVIVLAATAALIGYCWVEFCGGPVLSWKVVNVRPHQYYYAVDHMQDCWEVQIEVAVPLSRFTSRVGGGSAFFVRRQ
jgi:hypothetical protein